MFYVCYVVWYVLNHRSGLTDLSQLPRFMLDPNAPKTSHPHRVLLGELWPDGNKNSIFDRAQLKFAEHQNKSAKRRSSKQIQTYKKKERLI